VKKLFLKVEWRVVGRKFGERASTNLGRILGRVSVMRHSHAESPSNRTPLNGSQTTSTTDAGAARPTRGPTLVTPGCVRAVPTRLPTLVQADPRPTRPCHSLTLHWHGEKLHVNLSRRRRRGLVHNHLDRGHRLLHCHRV
jgi:hypothetical protein